MEEVLHFPGQRRISSKTRHYTVQPTMSEHERSESEEKEQLSPMIKKKSHFSTSKEDKGNFNIQECDLNEDEIHSPFLGKKLEKLAKIKDFFSF